MKRLIALAGRAGSGKNTVAELLDAEQISFAEPLKRFCQEVFAFSDLQVWGPSEERNRPDLRYPTTCQNAQCQRNDTCPSCHGSAQYLTPRYALQTLGTEWGRGCYENVWAELGVRRALSYRGEAPIVAITDCRFVNEARAVRQAGGEVWRIVRSRAGLLGAAGLHPSETEQESPEFLDLVNCTIRNHGTIEQLKGLLPSVLQQG